RCAARVGHVALFTAFAHEGGGRARRRVDPGRVDAWRRVLRGDGGACGFAAGGASIGGRDVLPACDEQSEREGGKGWLERHAWSPGKVVHDVARRAVTA